MSGRLTLEGTLAEAESKLRAGEVDQALAKAEALSRPFPDSVRVWRVRAQGLEQHGDHARAAEAYERVLEIVPTDLRAMSGLARSLQAVGRTQEAVLVAQQVLDYLPTDREMLALASRPALGGEAAVYRVALARLRSGLPSRALPYLRTLVTNHPGRTDLRLALAMALWRNQDHIAACEECWVVLSELPDCLVAHALLFDIWRHACAVSLEQMHLAHVERLDPDYRETVALFELNAPLSVREVLIQRPNGAHPRAQAEVGEPHMQLLADLLLQASSTAISSSPASGQESSRDAASFIVTEWSRAEDLSEVTDVAQASFQDVLSGEDELFFGPPRLPVAPEPGDDVSPRLEPLTWMPTEEAPASQPAAKPTPKPRPRPTRSARASTPKNALEREVLSASGAALDKLIDRLERAAATQPTQETLEALGLAYARRGSLEAALDAYQRALGKAK